MLQFREFYDQFIISHVSISVPEHFVLTKYGGWNVYHHPSLPVRILLSKDGQAWGLILGYPIYDGVMFCGDDPIIIKTDNLTERNNIAYLLTYVIAGRYLILVSNENLFYHALIPDPFCSLSCVFESKKQIAASTTTLLKYDSEKQIKDINSADFRNAPETYYPFGLTNDHEIFRLLPNHELCLRTFITKRFWPNTNIEPDNDSYIQDHVFTAFKAIQKNINYIGKFHKHIYSGLTAGRDSRVMLACSTKETRDKTIYYTWKDDKNSYVNACDIQTSKRLAKKNHLNFKIYKSRQLKHIDRMIYLDTIGYSGNAVMNPSYYYGNFCKENSSAAAMYGFGGEVLVSYFSNSSDEISIPSANDILKRMGAPQTNRECEAFDNWCDSFNSDIAPRLIIEIAYIENRVACWAVPKLYGVYPFDTIIIPFSDRVFIESCFRMPYDFRKLRSSQVEIIRLGDERLLDIPFQCLFGFEKIKRKILVNCLWDLRKLIKHTSSERH